KASELLKLLLEYKGEFVSKREIFDSVWAETFVEDGVLTQNIYTLRKILGSGEDGLPLIENKTRHGYRITVPIQTIETSNDNNADGGEIAFVAKTENNAEALPESLPRKPAANRKKPLVILAASLVLLSIAGFASYRFLNPPPEPISRIFIENVRFQKVTDTGDIFFPTVSPDGNLAAYKKGGGIYVKDLPSGAEAKLEISNVKKFGFLQFSKDGNFLYLRNRASYFLPSKVVKVSRYGGEAVSIAENVWSSFSLSPDETNLAFVRSFPNENRQSLILKNLKDGGEREIYKLNLPQEFNLRFYPAWSPDGRRIVGAIQKSNQEFLKIVVINAENGQAEDLLVKNFRAVEQVVWLPNKNALLAAAREERNFQLWEISYPAMQIKRLTNDLNNYQTLKVSDDGTKFLTMQSTFFSNLWVLDAENESVRKQLTFGTSNTDGYRGIGYFPGGEIVYASNEGANGDVNLWRVNPNDNQRRQLTANAGSRNENPSVSPDGKFVYFTSNRGGKPHIWRVESNGEKPQQITVGENSERFPQISPDGDWLYFIRQDRQASAVWRKFLPDSREEKITDEKKYAPVNFLALSPGGERLAFQNLTEQIDTENTKQNFQIAVIEITNPPNVKFFSIGGRKVEIYWTADGAAFDYILPYPEKDVIWRQLLDEKTEPQIFKTFPKETLFNLARPKNGKTYAVARGQLQYDAVLLTVSPP
ncbi:MAG: winged helix-turn-helix domain-containing protein, partial [Pyrinomonadaceae bacterium]|nr:winged helix-turn-helix domain-containing protein [Pyrinomonadaceae bacterium]